MHAHTQSTYPKIELNLGLKKNNVIINLLVRDQKYMQEETLNKVSTSP
jgi:hypothetical protein